MPVASDSLDIIGRFESCSDNTADGTTEIVAPTSPGRVLSTSGADQDYSLHLENLELVGSSMVANGGVIQIEGNYDVTAANVQVTLGMANFGGGVYIDGTDGATLTTSQSEILFINDNEAVRGGGGIYCTGPATIEFNRGAISNNTARGESETTEDNAGGGVALHNGCQMTTRAGLFLEGIYDNTLESPPVTGSEGGGGGVAVLSGSTFTAEGSPSHPAIIATNFSDTRGGGVHADGGSTEVDLKDSWVSNNQAGSAGGGLYVSGATLSMRRTLAGSWCHTLLRCSRLEGNSVLEGRQEFGGAVGINGGEVAIEGTFIEQNSAPTASVAFVDNVATLSFENTVAANNFGSEALLRIEQFSQVNVHWSTLAFNDLDTAVFSIVVGSTAGSIDLRGSVVWQPVIDLVASDINATRSGDCVMAADFTGFPELTRTSSGPPGFFAADDLRVTPEGEAVDFCDTAGVPNNTDGLGLVRPIDDPGDDAFGPYDLGAFEWKTSFGAIFSDRFEEP